MTTTRFGRASKRGQVLVITAGALMVLLAVAALVIDLGMSWMLRRNEQNGADPAAIAAARYIPAGDIPSMNDAACFYARQNDFFPAATANSGAAGCLPANDPQGATLKVNWPPLGNAAAAYRNNKGFVQVIIGRYHDAFFGRIFGQSRAWISTSAIAANTIQNANSASLVALDYTCDNGPGGKISGNNATVEIIPATGYAGVGGYVHVNSTCATHPEGAPDQCTNGTTDLKIDSANLITPHAYVHGVCTLNGTGANLTCAVGVTDCLTEGAPQTGDPLMGLQPPTFAEIEAAYGPVTCPDGRVSAPSDSQGCELKGSLCDDNGTPECELGPGIYYGGWKIGSNVELKLSPGIYVVAGGGITVNTGGIDVISGDPTVDARIMIFSTDNLGTSPSQCPANPAMCQGPIRMQAGSTFNAKAINTNTCTAQPVTCPFRNILLWQDGDGTNPDAEVKLGGQNSSTVTGTIYAPAAEVILNGGSNGTGCDPADLRPSCLAVQIVAWRFDITGGGYMQMPYDPAQFYQLPQKGLVH